MDVCVRYLSGEYHHQLYLCHEGDTPNARTGLSKTYDWAFAGRDVDPGVEVENVVLTAALRALNLVPKNGNPSSAPSDHLPILVSVD